MFLRGRKRYRRLMWFFFSIICSFSWLQVRKLWRNQQWIKERNLELTIKYVRRFREMAVEMGGLMIKLGQFFSTRVDIFPSVVIRELASLQDEVQELPFAALEPVFLSEFECTAETIFDWINPVALAAASLGQVHEGRLPDGTRVAIKILRPGIEDMTAIDLRVIRIVLTYLRRHTHWGGVFDLNLIYREFYDTVMAELDYQQEGKNAETLSRNLSSWPEVLCPKIYWEYSSQRVLTMEFMEGVKINQFDEIEAMGVDRHKIAKQIIDIYCQQLLVDGFFHADPHPGNLLVNAEGKLIVLDFGMVGYIEPVIRQQIVKFCITILKRDYVSAAEQLTDMGFLRPHADARLIGRLLQVLVEVFMASRQRPDNNSFQQLLLDLESLLYSQPFQIPGHYVFIGRAGGILLGVCADLDPAINFVETARPYFDRFIKDERIGILHKLKDEGQDWITNMIALPPHLQRVLHQLEHGDITVKVQQHPLVAALEQQNQSIQILVQVLLFGIFVAMSCFLLIHGWGTGAKLGFVVSGLLLVWILISLRRLRLLRPPKHLQ